MAEALMGITLAENPDRPGTLLAHDADCPYIEGDGMPWIGPELSPNIARHDCLLDERGHLTV